MERDETVIGRNVHQFVCAYLRQRGLTIREIANAVGVSVTTVQRWTTDANRLGSVADLLPPPKETMIKVQPEAAGVGGKYVCDSDSAILLMNSEGLFVDLYGKDLIRKHKGCDFRDPDSGVLIEVKTGILSEGQIREIVSELYDEDRKAILAIMRGDMALMFRLDSILVRKRPKAAADEGDCL